MNATDIVPGPALRFHRIGAALATFFLAGLALWLAADLLRTAFFSLTSFGPLALLTDGVLHFRVGAVLVILPLASYLLFFSRAADERRADYLRRARRVMWVGAGLCALALFTLSGRVSWTFLSGVIAFVGVLAPRALKEPFTRRRKISSWGNLVLLIFLYGLVAAVAWLTTGDPVAPYPAPYPLFTTNRDERWRQDVRYLASELARMHVNAYHSISAADFQAQASQLEAEIPRLTDDQVAFRIIGLAAAVGDAHTAAYLPSSIRWHTYPVTLRWFADGLYVTGASAEYQPALGARVLGIGKLSAEQLDQAIQPLVSHENDYWARETSPQLLNNAEALHTVGAIDDPAAPATFRLSGADGRELALEIAPLQGNSRPKMLSAFQKTAFFNRGTKAQWLEYREKTHTLYFRYAACIDPPGFKSLMGELWRVVDTQPVDRLIVDLRGNFGGMSNIFDSWFVPEVVKRAQLNRPDKLFVLIDSGTFSSGSYNATTMQQQTRATFAGEPTGGKPNHYGELRSFVLPNSKMRVTYTVQFFQLVPGDPPSLLPDRLIPLTARDAFAGRDPVLETIAPGEEWTRTAAPR